MCALEGRLQWYLRWSNYLTANRACYWMDLASSVVGRGVASESSSGCNLGATDPPNISRSVRPPFYLKGRYHGGAKCGGS
jgi:hypothetical protein